MIRVEFQEPLTGSGADYQVVAVLVVTDEGTYHFEEGSDPVGLPEIPVPVTDAAGAFTGSVTLAEDPAYWARNIDLSLRTPYLVPVITNDEGFEENA